MFLDKVRVVFPPTSERSPRVRGPHRIPSHFNRYRSLGQDAAAQTAGPILARDTPMDGLMEYGESSDDAPEAPGERPFVPREASTVTPDVPSYPSIPSVHLSKIAPTK